MPRCQHGRSCRLRVNFHDGAEKQAAALPSTMSLQELFLVSNNIGNIGAEKLAAALLAMKSFRIFAFGDNNIGDGGAVELAAALPSLTNLEAFNLYIMPVRRKRRTRVYTALPASEPHGHGGSWATRPII